MSAKQKLEVLMEQVENIVEREQDTKEDMARVYESLGVMRSEFTTRATEKALAYYIEKVARGLQKECGDKPYTNKLGEQDPSGKHFQSEDSILLK